jgi:3-hydroxyisobutyrate dehydrogenase
VFDAVAARVVELGDEPGAATRMKLVLNAWLLALIEGLSESVALAEALGVDPAAFLEIIDGGPVGPPYAKMKGTMMIERAYEPSFSLALAAKDARLALEAADAAGLELPALEATRAQLERAVEQGHGDEDMAAAVEATRPG